MLRVPRSRLPQGDSVEVGFQILTRTASGEPRTFRVTDVGPKFVVIDGNHPFAGQELRFEVKATSARRATARDFMRELGPEPAPLRSRYGPYLQ